jgi:DNA-directed RNA polymerase specialized sigma24 family protein
MATVRARELLQSLDSRDDRVASVDLAEAPHDVEDEVGRRLELEPLLRAVAALTETEVKVLEAKLEGEGAYAELAAELGLPVGTIRVQAHRLMQRLVSEVRAAGVDRHGKEANDAVRARKAGTKPRKKASRAPEASPPRGEP